MRQYFIAYWDDVDLDEPVSIYSVNAGTLAEAERLVNSVATTEERRHPVLELTEVDAHKYKKIKKMKIKEVKVVVEDEEATDAVKENSDH